MDYRNRRDFYRRVAQGIYGASAMRVLLDHGRQALNDYFFKNKILPTNTMAYPRRPRTRRSSTAKKYKRKAKRSRKAKTKRYSRPKTSLKKKVQQISRQLNSDRARHVYKYIHAWDLASAINGVNYASQDFCTGTQIEGFMANLRYYDPSVPGTLVTASGATGTYQREIFFKNVHATCEVRNNYQVPCKVKIYLVQPKGDTNISPTTYYNNSITDQLIGGGSVVTPAIYPTDLNAFMAQWKCKCIKDVYLDAGATVIVQHSTGSFKYDPALFDSHNLDYQNKFKTFSFLIRLEGVIGHDTTADQQTTLDASVDMQFNARAEILYDAGINLDDIYLSNNRAATFTNSGVVSNKPIADNQAWSKA